MNDGNGGLYFIVGGLCVLVFGFLYFGGFVGHRGGHSSSSTTTIERTITPDSSSTTTTRRVQ